MGSLLFLRLPSVEQWVGYNCGTNKNLKEVVLLNERKVVGLWRKLRRSLFRSFKTSVAQSIQIERMGKKGSL